MDMEDANTFEINSFDNTEEIKNPNILVGFFVYEMVSILEYGKS